LNTNDLSKLHHTTKIAVIISDLEIDTQIKRVFNLTNKLKKNNIISIISENNVPKIIKISVYTIEKFKKIKNYLIVSPLIDF